MATWKHQNKYRYEFTVKGVRYGDSGYATKREAKEAEAEHRKRIKKRKTKNLKFKELCDERLTELKARCTHHYYDENEKLIDKLLDRWSYKTVIERKDMRRFLNGEKPTMANKYLRFIRAMFNFGINEGLIDYDPTKGIKFYPVDKKLKYIPPIEDITKVLSQAKPKDRDFLLTLAYTMGRISEIRNLKWSDIYEDHLILRTRKSKNSNLVERSIPLPGPLKEVIDGIEKTANMYLHHQEPDRNMWTGKNCWQVFAETRKLDDFHFTLSGITEHLNWHKRECPSLTFRHSWDTPGRQQLTRICRV